MILYLIFAKKKVSSCHCDCVPVLVALVMSFAAFLDILSISVCCLKYTLPQASEHLC